MSLTDGYTPTDDFFGAPFVDVDEMRAFPRPHRYVHGGFTGTDTLFSFYFPDASLYGGRFCQFVEGGGGGNDRSITITDAEPSQWDYLYDMAFDDLNGYLIESNQGHLQFDTKPEPVEGLHAWRGSTESARFSRHVAAQIYGQAPKYGYIGGIGGGGGRAVYCMENAPDVYDACTPQVIGSSASSFAAMQRAVKFLGAEKLKEVVDAVEPGGSGDPYATLNALQREALADLYRTGFPRGAENQIKSTRTIAFIYTAMERMDPSYFTDFWTVPGYAGADKAELLKPYLIKTKAKVTRVTPIVESMEPATFKWYAVIPPDTPFGVEIDIPGKDEFYGCEMNFLTGEAKGRNLLVVGTLNGLSGAPERTPQMMHGVKVGDEIELDNSRFLAFIHSFLYSVRASSFVRKITGQEISRMGRPFAPDGVPLYPQRAAAPSLGDLSGDYQGKMIYVLSTHDIYVWPVTADYPDIYRAGLGEALDDKFRFYWAEKGAIGPPQLAVGYNVGEGDLRVWDTRLINFQHSMGRQVWAYLRDWVEHGKAPPASTGYEFNADNALILPSDAKARAGIQPVVRATAEGAKRVEVKVGQPVTFEATVEVPPGAGAITEAGWDFDEIGEFGARHPEAEGLTSARLSRQHAFDRPGVYFPSFRAGVHRDGKAGKGLPIHNLDRVRVIVR